MADSLKDFFIEIGFEIDEASQRKAESSAAATQARVSANAEAEGQKRISREEFRQKLAATGSNDLSKVKIEAERTTTTAVDKLLKDHSEKSEMRDTEVAKKQRERRDLGLKEFQKSLLGIEAVAGRVAMIAGTIGSALVDTSIVRNIMGVAGAYSQLAQQAERTRSAPGAIKALVYGLSQMGVDAGEANSSYEGFSKALLSSPGLKTMLAGAGVRMKGDDGRDRDAAAIFADLGTYFNTMPYNVALARAGQFGIGQNVLNALEKPGELQGQMGRYGETSTAFGLDPEQASKDGRELTSSYNRMAEDLKSVHDRIAAQFFKPMADGFDAISKAMEAHPDATVRLSEGLLAFAGVMSLRVVPVILRLTGAMSLLTALVPPAWLLRFLGVPGVVATVMNPTALNKGEPQVGPDGTLTYPDGHTEQGHVWDGKEAPRKPEEGGALSKAWNWTKNKLGFGGASAVGSGRARLGRRVGTDSYAADTTLSPEARGLLDTIAGTESPGYNVGYGGTKFGSYADHPREAHVITSGPNAGRTTTAAGRYQFLASTWDPIARKYGLKDYSPESQDKGAWYLAQEEYHRQTGRKLGDDLKSTDPTVLGNIGNALRGQWTSLPGGIEAGTNADRFSSELNRNKLREAAKLAANTTVAQKISASMSNARGQAAIGPQMASLPDLAMASTLSRGLTLTHPLGVTPSLYADYDNSRSSTRGDSTFNQNVTIHGVQKPDEVAGAVKAHARRGGQDFIRYMEGSTQ